jgi:hypothetical protein
MFVRIMPLRPSWFMWVTYAHCGKDRMFSETYAAQGDMLIRDILKRMRHDGCGGRPGRVELERQSSPMPGRVTGGWRRMGTSMTAVASGPHQREARTSENFCQACIE